MLNSRSPFERNPLGTVGSIIVALVVLYLLFVVASFVFELLWYAGPILLLISLFIDYKVALGYLGWIKRLFQSNIVYGIAASILTVVAFPLVCLYIFGMAMFKRKVNKVREEVTRRREGEYTEYEEVDSFELDELPYEELPPAREPEALRERRRPRTDDDKNTPYDELFK